MCTRQLTIINPHYKKLAEDFNVSIKCFVGQEDFKLHVPCGHCDECLKKRQQQWFLRANHVMKRLKLRPDQCLFCTFSIKPEVYEQTKDKPYLAIRRFMDRLRKHPRFREKGPSGRYRYRKVRFPYIFVVEFADGKRARERGLEDSEIKVDLDADGKSISFRNIAAQSHIQRWLDLSLAGGARYTDYLDSHFDVSRLKHTTSPLYLGSDRQYLGSNVIYQTTGAGDPSSPLGAFAGQASGGETFRKRSYHFGENGYFVVMASLVPDVIYSRGMDPFNREKTLADVYVPALDNIAMEPLMVEQVDALGSLRSFTRDDKGIYILSVTPDSQTKNSALGYVPAWSKIMQSVSRAHGRLTTDLKYWLLTRDYGVDVDQIKNLGVVGSDVLKNFASELNSAYQAGYISYEHLEALTSMVYRLQAQPNYTPYVLPNAYNDVFADVSNQAQNFVLTCTFSMTCNREKGKVNTPTTI
jgi:hypothetical protein